MIIGPSESMSKSKKNVIDPESMIKSYGADALDGLFYQTALQKKTCNGLSQGVNAAYKFLQKLYNLNQM